MKPRPHSRRSTPRATSALAPLTGAAAFLALSLAPSAARAQTVQCCSGFTQQCAGTKSIWCVQNGAPAGTLPAAFCPYGDEVVSELESLFNIAAPSTFEFDVEWPPNLGRPAIRDPTVERVRRWGHGRRLRDRGRRKHHGLLGLSPRPPRSDQRLDGNVHAGMAHRLLGGSRERVPQRDGLANHGDARGEARRRQSDRGLPGPEGALLARRRQRGLAHPNVRQHVRLAEHGRRLPGLQQRLPVREGRQPELGQRRHERREPRRAPERVRRGVSEPRDGAVGPADHANAGERLFVGGDLARLQRPLGRRQR